MCFFTRTFKRHIQPSQIESVYIQIRGIFPLNPLPKKKLLRNTIDVFMYKLLLILMFHFFQQKTFPHFRVFGTTENASQRKQTQ